MAIGKKVKKKSEDTINTTKRVISTNVKSVQRQKANGTYNTGRQNVGASLRSNGEAQADWGSKVRAPKAYDTKTLRQRASYSSAVAAKNKEDSKPKSFSGSAMKVRASYRNSVARSGYAKKLRTQELRGKSQISYKKPNTTTIPTPTMTSNISRAVEKRDYATPESNIGRKTRNKMITRKYGR